MAKQKLLSPAQKLALDSVPIAVRRNIWVPIAQIARNPLAKANARRISPVPPDQYYANFIPANRM